jgi:hypothetical protein
MRSAKVRDWNAGSPGTHQIGAQSAQNPSASLMSRCSGGHPVQLPNAMISRASSAAVDTRRASSKRAQI